MDGRQNSVFIQNGLIKINKPTQLRKTQSKKSLLPHISSWIGSIEFWTSHLWSDMQIVYANASDFPFTDSMKYWKHFGKL